LLFGGAAEPDYGVVSIHHVGILCENLERSLAFYKDLLGELAIHLVFLLFSACGVFAWTGKQMS
jgi:hypothetical protein